MSWHYQVRKRILKGEPWFDIVESYENPTGWTVDSIAPGGNTKEELMHELTLMLADIERYPVIDEITPTPPAPSVPDEAAPDAGGPPDPLNPA